MAWDGYIDVRGQNPKQLEAFCQKLAAEGRAERIATVSLGDEIGLESPPKPAPPALDPIQPMPAGYWFKS